MPATRTTKTLKTPKASAPEAPEPSLAQRLSALEATVAKLSQLARRPPQAKATALAKTALPTDGDDRFWALNGLHARNTAQAVTNGSVLYTGRITTPQGRQYSWQRQDSTDALLAQDWSALADTVAALGHPVRLAVLKACLGAARSTQELLALPDMGTTGQLFHHLKALQQSGWLRSLQRGTYEVPADRIVPLLSILLAAKG